MEIIDYIFIICCVIGIFSLLVLILRPFIPKYMMLKSKEISIKRGERIGAVMGITIGLFILFYINVNGYYDMIVDYLKSLLS
tara:strand:- start:16216 stop:16461 length:246 start_codon:yes stop_codon:yes gene_type:complete